MRSLDHLRPSVKDPVRVRGDKTMVAALDTPGPSELTATPENRSTTKASTTRADVPGQRYVVDPGTPGRSTRSLVPDADTLSTW